MPDKLMPSIQEFGKNFNRFTHVIFYHANCMDGWLSAVMARAALGECCLFEAREYQKELSNETLEACAGRTVFILDFSFPKEDLFAICRMASRVYVIDHHKTFAENLGRDPAERFTIRAGEGDGSMTLHYDPVECGASLTSKLGLLPQDVFSSELIAYVRDRDLWQWKLQDSHEVSEYLAAVPKTYADWHALGMRFDSSILQIVETGSVLLNVKKQNVDRRCAKAFWLVIGGHNVPVVNSMDDQSEIGHRLCELYPHAAFGAIYYAENTTGLKWSLRGRSSDDFDVSEIAKKFGGGGHKKAAGFNTTLGVDPLLFHQLREVVISQCQQKP